uniref:Uncharacterized protein n=1 Tax=Attheya septentrionalis TaxID=420275 RepID=A0A7S2UJ79_9STRA|mmetsp:Transcript_24630/g.44568  ORF Transcript_24630/g.44568 Transcript_24630/m.44568 type:complete len:559 (+) Transcript_24630:106-1782(+)
MKSSSNEVMQIDNYDHGRDKRIRPAAIGGTGISVGTQVQKDNAFCIITNQPPSHLFSDEWFELHFRVLQVVVTNTPDSMDNFEMSLYSCDESGNPNELVHKPTASLKVENLTSTADRSGLFTMGTWRDYKIRCKINKAKRENDHPYRIQLAVRNTLFSIMFNSISIVRYKLLIDLTLWDSVFYKDEGGRDKCVRVKVSLLDKAGTTTTCKEQVNLGLTLLYDNANGIQFQHVLRQDILCVIGPPKNLRIDPGSVSTTVCFRIDDVSKNHVGQSFRILISSLDVNGVAPVMTPPVTVKSKRSKRRRLSETKKTEIGPLPDASSGMEFTDTFEGKPPIVSKGRRRLSTTKEPEIGPLPEGGSSDIELTDIFELKSPIVSKGSSEVEAVNDSRSEDARSITSGTPDTEEFLEAIKGITQWSKEVVENLQDLQWQIIGYEQLPDGSFDSNRPLYKMSNPNERIDKLRSTYHSDVKHNMNTVRSMIEKMARKGENVEQHPDAVNTTLLDTQRTLSAAPLPDPILHNMFTNGAIQPERNLQDRYFHNQTDIRPSPSDFHYLDFK